MGIFRKEPKADNTALPVKAFSNTPESILPPTRAVAEMSVDQALTLTSVYRATQILTTTCSQLEMGAWKTGVELKPTPLVIYRPDFERTRVDFLKRTIANLALTGNAYFYATKNNRGEPTNIRTLAPSSVNVRFNESGKKFYDVTGTDAKTRTYTDKEIQHLRLMEVEGHALGLGPIQAGRATLTNARAIRDYQANWFSVAGGVPSGTLNTDQDLDPEQAKAILQAWYAMLSENKTAVLPKGIKYNAIGLNPADSQWLEASGFSVTDVARLFGIPVQFLAAAVDGTSMTYSNIQTENTQFYQRTLQAYLSLIESAMTDILPRGQEVKFKLDAYLRADDKTRYESYEVAIRAGVLTVNEAREKEGLEPLPEPKAPAPAVEPPTEDQPEPESDSE